MTDEELDRFREGLLEIQAVIISAQTEIREVVEHIPKQRLAIASVRPSV